MAQNPDITKYFSDDSFNNSQFFQKSKDVEESSNSVPVDSKNVDASSNSNDKNDEPVICKIFQSSNIKKTLDPDPSSFFDTIGTIEKELVQSYEDQGLDSTTHSSGLNESGNILNSLKAFDENFSKLPRVSESERSRDAWIIPDATRKVLIQMVTSPPGSYVSTKDNLTMPGVILEEELKDTVYEAVHHYLGENEASKRVILTPADVTQDERGIRSLIQAGCYRGAVNLTKVLLTMYGQGAERAGRPSKHRVHSIQLWFTRLALLMKLRSFSLAHVESEPFGDLEKPDMFFQFYPELYGGRTGTMVPFSMRLLIAQIPAYIEKHQLALTRLHAILGTVRKILSNLNKGLYEDGTMSDMKFTPEARKESIKLWASRETRVLHAIISTALGLKDYSLALELIQELIDREQDLDQKRCIQSALGRILLQLGDIVSAEKQFALARSSPYSVEPRDIIDSGLCLLTQNQFHEAYLLFKKAYEMDPKNIMALNNMSVCLLYLGKLKQAVLLLEDAIQKYTSIALHENLLLNLCTLYELQSSFYSQAKLKLLMLVNENKGDGFNIGCLKL